MRRSLVLALLLSVSGCDRLPTFADRPKGGVGPVSAKPYVAAVNLSGGAPESPLGDGLFPAPASSSFGALVRELERLQKDPQLKGVFVTTRSSGVNFAQAEEIGEALAALAGRKIPVVCHAHEVGNAKYWMLRRGCTELWVSDAGAVPTVGIGAELAFLKGAFDKVGVSFDMLAMGKYKSGGEALTRTEPSEPSLDNLRSTLSDLRDQWLDGVTRGQSGAGALREHVEDGPWSPLRARQLKMVEQLGYEEEARDSVKKKSGTELMRSVFGPGSEGPADSPMADLVRLLAGAGDREHQRERIALVPAVGGITMAADGPFGGGTGITAAAMVRTLRRLREDDKVRAVVMRMDSPGGSPLASDLIWREMMLTRDEKPVIVSIASMSASGGYYIASGATTIVASPTAIVGSIGVFGGKLVLEGAMEKIGVNTVQVPASPEPGAAERAGHLSPFVPWDEPTKERVRETMRRIYDLFIERVAEGRDMKPADVRATAEGEVFLAPVGVARGLVDELGGLSHALAVARKAAGLKDSIPVVLEGAEETLLEALFLSPQPGAQDIEAAVRRYEERRADAAVRWALGDASATLEPHRAALGPLFAGEVVVTALPYGLRLE